MTENPGVRPDHHGTAFRLAAQEFDECGEWTKKDAVDRLNENDGMQSLLRIEPRLSPIISHLIQIKASKGYNQSQEYSRVKSLVYHLVGDGAEKPEIQDSESYDVLIHVISDLLPPDVADLYPNGFPEGIVLDI
jgi:hypothetical protein